MCLRGALIQKVQFMQQIVSAHDIAHDEIVGLCQRLINQSTNSKNISCFSSDELESLSEMSLETLHLLNRPESIQALHSGSFTLTEIVDKDDAFIEVLLWPLCLEALFLERTTIDLLEELNVVELHAAIVTDEYPTHTRFSRLGM